MKRVFFGISVLLLTAIAVAGGPEQQQFAIPDQAGTVERWYAYAINKLVGEHGIAAVLGGLLVSFVVTQLAKARFVEREWSTKQLVWYTRLTAFVSGFLATSLIWPMTYDWDHLTTRGTYVMVVSGLIMAVIVGGSSPLIYKLAVAFAYKRKWLNAETFSAETRAEMKRMGVAEAAGVEPNENGVH